MNNSYKELPENYEKVFEIDAKNKKTGLIFNLIAFIVMIIAVVIAFLTKNVLDEAEVITAKDLIDFSIKMICFAASMFVYVILHELLHGIAYKAMTKEKLKFGISWSCAFCGVPEVYVNRKTALIALACPLVVFTIVFGALIAIFWFTDALLYFLTVILMGMHLGGCSGDLYMLILLLFKYKSKTLLLNDDGPKQTIYDLKK